MNTEKLLSKGIFLKVVCIAIVMALLVGIVLMAVLLKKPVQTVENGLSAYELAVKYGYDGTVEEWLESLNGKTAYEIAADNGYTGTEAEWTKAIVAASKQKNTGISSAKISAEGELVLVLADGSELTVGIVVGANGNNGTNGKNGVNGKDGADGKNGADGVGIAGASINENGQLILTYTDGKQVNLDKIVGINGTDGVGIAQTELNNAGEMLITYTNGQQANLGRVIGADGKNGTNGADGKDGNDGKDGISITNSIINDSGELVITYSDNTTANLGKVVGNDGKDGINGTNGADGISVTGAEINTEGELVISFSNGQKSNLGVVIGRDGINGTNGTDGTDGLNGKDGIGIAKSEINSKGELVITYTDGNVSNLGVVVGTPGKDGADGKDGIDGTNGVNGKNGTDGKDGVGIQQITISEAGQLQIVLTNGTNLNLGVIKGADGKDGINGKDGADGRSITDTTVNAAGELIITYSDNTYTNLGKVAGIDGEDGANGTDGKDGISVINTEINASGELVIYYSNDTEKNLGKVVGRDGTNGKNGADGKDGMDGKDGADGVGITMAEINDDGQLLLYFSNNTEVNLGKVVGTDGKNGVDGINGKDGINGTNGTNGVDGKDGVGIETVTVSEAGQLFVKLTSGTELNLGNIKGKDGIGISKSEINASGELVLTYTSGQEVNLGKVVGTDGKNGADGTNGKDGVGIADVTVTAEGKLTVTLTDTTVLDLGNVRGPQGEKGEIGATGPQGLQGPAGEDGQDGEDGKTPYIKDGYWWIGDVNTNVKAEGTDGQNGANGKDGINGTDGVSVVNAYVDEELHLWIVLSNGTKIDAGYVGVSTGGNTPPTVTTYTVTFKDWNGDILKTETVESGKSATAPADPMRSGYVFTGWDKVYSEVTSNLVVTATYTHITDPTIVIGNVTGNAGDEVIVTIDLMNSPELYAMSLKIAFDDTALTLVSAESGEAMDTFTYTNPSRLKNGSNFMWYANDPATGNGTVLSLTFKINQVAAQGTYPITMTCDPSNTYDENDNDVNLKFVYGSIVVAD